MPDTLTTPPYGTLTEWDYHDLLSRLNTASDSTWYNMTGAGAGTWEGQSATSTPPARIRNITARIRTHMRGTNSIYLIQARAALNYFVAQQEADGRWESTSSTSPGSTVDDAFDTAEVVTVLWQGYEYFDDETYHVAARQGAQWLLTGTVSSTYCDPVYYAAHPTDGPLAQCIGFSNANFIGSILRAICPLVYELVLGAEASATAAVQALLDVQDANGTWAHYLGSSSDTTKSVVYHELTAVGLVAAYDDLSMSVALRANVKHSIFLAVQYLINQQASSGKFHLTPGSFTETVAGGWLLAAAMRSTLTDAANQEAAAMALWALGPAMDALVWDYAGAVAMENRMILYRNIAEYLSWQAWLGVSASIGGGGTTLAQGDFMQMGVAVEIKNPSFRWGTEKTTTLNGVYTSTTTLNVNATTPTLVQVFKAKDRILVGPSTDTDSADTGHQETRQITAVGATSFTLVTALTYDYFSTDPVGGIGSNLAGGWTPAGNVVMGGIDGGGKDDDYAQKINFGAATSDYLEQTGLATLEVATKYRLGCYIKSGLGGVNNKIRVKAHDGASYFIGAATSVGMDSKTSFTRYTDTGTTSSTWTLLGAAAIRTEWMMGTPTDTEIDCVWLEHAKGTTAASSGFYTFTEVPNLGIQWGREPQFSSRRLANNTLRRYASSGAGQKTRKHFAEMQFSWASQAFWDNLMVFQNWQEQGQLLSFHPFIDDLPPVMVGVMDVIESNRAKKEQWDLGQHSFTLTFLEV